MSTDGRSENMRRLNEDPDFAAARDERARERFAAENDRLQRLAKIARRGVDVPDHLEDRWRQLKQMKVPNKEAARILGLAWLGDPEDADEMRWANARVEQIAAEAIDLLEDSKTIDPDEAFEVVERLKRIQRIIAWNLPQETDQE